MVEPNTVLHSVIRHADIGTHVVAGARLLLFQQNITTGIAVRSDATQSSLLGFDKYFGGAQCTRPQ